jgi:putative glutamine amidotransferase
MKRNVKRSSQRSASPLVLISASTDPKGVEFGDASLSLSMNYVAAIRAAGGMPWLLPCLPERALVAEAVRRCDGILLTGGDVVEPRLYRSEVPARLARTVERASPERDLFELMLVDEVFRQRKPLFAICRGQQILNVALGGTLLVDIHTQISKALNHSCTDRKDQLVHDVRITPGSLLATLVGRHSLGVNSSHHQAVAKLAEPLRVSARSADGVIEGLELKRDEEHLLPYLLAVQFHPERLFDRHGEHAELFRSFIRACRRHRTSSV